uniref:Large ribosomal subunit protein eL13 n=1 Tax=Ignisphaera aggregans TaxID=334771 RepID=A0A7C2ZP32_9CREN
MESENIVVVEVPSPVVKAPKIIKERGTTVSLRVGRGFSVEELKQVGLSVQLAKQLNIPIDFRRHSVHQQNLENLKKFIEKVTILINAKKTKPARIVQQSQEAQEKQGS